MGVVAFALALNLIWPEVPAWTMVERVLSAIVGGFIAVYLYIMLGGPAPADYDVGILFWKNPPQFICMIAGAWLGCWLTIKYERPPRS